MESEYVEISGARVHNLKNIDVKFPRYKLVVITGLSGSGKSSLAFDTLFAEGQRRYMETFSAYARQFMGSMERPDVDKITGLSPVISIEQKTTHSNPRSTVGTVTEIYDFLRLLFARASDAYSFKTGEQMVRLSDEEVLDRIRQDFNEEQVVVLAPVVKARKGHYRELFESVIRMGFLQVRIDGVVTDLKRTMQVDRYKTHDIEIVIDKLLVNSASEQRLKESLALAMKHGKGSLLVATAIKAKTNSSRKVFTDIETGDVRHYSRNLVCPTSGISYDEPQPNTFSFNSPYGACVTCNGLGTVHQVDRKKIIPDPTKNISNGGLLPLAKTNDKWIFKQLETLGQRYNFNLKTPIAEISEEALNVILYGSDEQLQVPLSFSGVSESSYATKFEGILNLITRHYEEGQSTAYKSWAEEFMHRIECPDCKGMRLKKESLHFKIDRKNIAELAAMDLSELANWFDRLENRISEKQRAIAREVVKEISTRLQFLLDVGLDYLSINRTTQSLSGGEAQRIRLATQIGSQLVGVLYILDEPSIGLHQRDNDRLIRSLQNLRDIGNTVVVVEHDKQMILSADHIIDMGPRAGVHGGLIVAQGTPEKILASYSLTASYLNNIHKIKVPAMRRAGNGHSIEINGCSGNNLKHVNVEFPLGKFICVTGVSGSGKSTLINETLYPILKNRFYHTKDIPLPYEEITGLEHIDKVIEIDQSAIGRTPRSNPATYTGVFTEIRTLFARLPESQIRGYAPGRFSFNVKGGRCETCMGGGMRLIEMNFLPDVYVQCETCQGKRYNRETLEIRFKGKSISDVLAMSIDQAVDFFKDIHMILAKIKALQEVGLGYITLGQSSTTLSGGEAQRVKLATELAKKDTGSTFYILDEPTTGLHFEDIRILLEVLDRLVDKGNTVLVIEHNMDVIKVADHIIDMGPEGGHRGGQLLCQGRPEEVILNTQSLTAAFLKQELQQ